MSWNVAHLGENFNGLNVYRSLMLDLIRTQNADILCFQEYFEFYDQPGHPVNIPDIEKMGYPYHYFFPTSIIHDGKSQFGLCFFSKFPIIDSAEFKEGINTHSEGLCYIDVKIQNKVYRVFTTHLQSVGFGKNDYEGLGSIETSRGIFGKIKTSYQIRSMQAEMVRKEINTSPYPVIVCGDLDDVPNSYAYFTVKGDLQDAFLKSGFALGRTLRFISPTLRIDYILADKKFGVKQFNRIVSPYSDHYPIIADLKIIN
jgi:endonuclease/exonuclease/phosphatase family metal-dependent hydrolase